MHAAPYGLSELVGRRDRLVREFAQLFLSRNAVMKFYGKSHFFARKGRTG
jgi:hypothetical protein